MTEMQLACAELDDLLVLQERLTAREMEFIEKANARRSTGQVLTARQVAKIDEIWGRRC